MGKIIRINTDRGWLKEGEGVTRIMNLPVMRALLVATDLLSASV